MARTWRKRIHEIAPDEIFLDASNLPEHESSQFEGRIAKELSRFAIAGVGALFVLVGLVFAGRAFSLQVMNGASYAEVSRSNTLDRAVLFATRGRILDRNGSELAWSEAQIPSGTAGGVDAPASSSRPLMHDGADPSVPNSTFALRKYTAQPGFSVLLGYVQYPRQDAKGNWWREEYTGIAGIERSFDASLRGENGSRMIETNARGRVERENIVSPPQGGADLKLSIDADVQTTLYSILSDHAARQGFRGGAALIMDVRSGELLALVSFPEYNNTAFSEGDVAAVRAASNDPRTPMLDRAIAGLYAPGSIVKPMFAAAALNEGIISPDKVIVSTGAISLPNPYDPEKPTVFRDWAVHGPVTMREAIAVSSDEYFYTIGGGYGGQRGLGIAKLDEYSRLFGLASTTGIQLPGEQDGVIPTPEWKAKVFGADDPWRIGNTYHTAIGQYGFQVTPIEAVRYIGAIANGGRLMKPRLLASSTPEAVEVGIPDKYLQIVREGMRLAVTSTRQDATVRFLNIPGIEIAAKTGTAEIGARNEFMNSWSVGFWPVDKPRFAYAVVLERAKAGTPSGAAPGMLPFFQWLIAHHPEYTK